jgi:mannose-6-phosphate isomerase-like protein (cupin superfamily)
MDRKNKNDFDERPWGQYLKVFQEPGVWVKRIEVKPGARLSLQKHSHRTEKWVIVTGEGVAVVNDKEIPVKPGTVVEVPLGAVHRIGNTGKSQLVFIEVATGDILSEDDIIRLQDDYKRA